MINTIIEKYKNSKKQGFLNSPKGFNNDYAFIGVGGHSISNLYPVILFLGVPIKMVFSRTIENASKMAGRFSGAVGVDNIDQICDNEKIKSVFICSKPDLHFEYVKKCLLAGKNVFVDKPPCTSMQELDELIEIEKKSDAICIVGLQRRYAPVYTKVSVLASKAISYNYKFYSGAYPEGNILYDLFIHPIDLLIYLFGEIVQTQVNTIKNNKGVNFSILTEHKNGCKGIADFSSFYSWKKLEESLRIVCKNSYIDVNYPLELIETKLQGQFMGIPLEKALPKRFETQHIHHINNGLNPVKEQNILYDQGFYGEIINFTNITEGKNSKNHSTLSDKKNLYKTIDILKTHL